MALGSRFAARAARAIPAGVLAVALLAAAAASAAPTKVAGGIQFTYLDPNARSVNWAGQYNGWNATANPMTKDANGRWSIVLPLPAGEHQYKFVADGQWIADPENPVTGGDFGNSVVNVGANGDLVAMQATSNTPYSPKIFIGGRMIGLYQAIRDEQTNRFGLKRPDMIVDMNFDIRVSEVLKANFLLNFESRAQDVELYRGRLNFDRGSLEFRQPKFQILAYDNVDAGTWDDPLRLVGNVGIYGYPYGYERQGFRARGQYLGFESELQYADNFQTGGSTYPAPYSGAMPYFYTDDGAGGYALVPGSWSTVVNRLVSDGNEDMLAFRASRKVGGGFTLGVLGRTDRGFNLGGLTYLEATGPGSARSVSGNFEQEWYAAGGEARWKHPSRDLWAEAGYLFGRTRAVMVPNGVGATATSYDVTFDASGDATFTETGVGAADGEHFDLDGSNRFALRGGGTFAQGDIGVRAGVEYQGHAYELVLDGLENSLLTWSAGWDRNWRYYLNREVKTRLDVEYVDFDYDPATPWEYQLWFPTGNFWLEHGEHLVQFGRLTLLGGNDVVAVRPALEVPLLRRRNMTFRWNGNFLGVDLGHRPKYSESIFQFGMDLTRNLRLHTDTRWAKYDDPVLGLDDGYVSHFVETVYDFGGGLQLALSTGVDPWVLDRTTNEYASIGRDLFLFGRGANGAAAESNYFGLKGAIPAAEKALRDERRIQVEAILKF